MWLTSLINRSTFDWAVRSDLADSLGGISEKEAKELEEMLLLHQLDITQLPDYNNDDINNRLNWLDLNERY